jgi:hypothetical protein
MRTRALARFCIGAWSLALLMLAIGCGSDGDGPMAAGARSNRARFTFRCDLQGANATLTMDVEAVAGTGVTLGSGSSPTITGVIGTGSVLYITAGEVRSTTALYTFTGDNNFADMLDQNTLQRFRVRWDSAPNGIVMTVNPFGPGPVQYACALTDARYT